MVCMEVIPKNLKTMCFEFLIYRILSISDSRGLHATAKTILQIGQRMAIDMDVKIYFLL